MTERLKGPLADLCPEPCKCDSCDWTGDVSDTDECDDLLERLGDAGDVVTIPAGDCPECGAFVFPVEPPPAPVASSGYLNRPCLSERERRLSDALRLFRAYIRDARDDKGRRHMLAKIDAAAATLLAEMDGTAPAVPADSAPRALVSDLWDFIENVTDDAPDRQDRFFALRARVRGGLAATTAKVEG